MNGRKTCVTGLLALMGWSLAGAASAQDKGDVGLTISAPSAIGVIWHATDRLAIRPDVSFTFSETDGDDGLLPDISSSSISFGVSALFYTHRWDDLRLYVSPRLTYGHGSTSISNGISTDSDLSSWGLAGSIGGQYALGSRFAVFAEAGMAYASQESQSSISLAPDRTTWTLGSRTAIGGVIYF